MQATITELMTRRGYPHYLKRRIGSIDLVSYESVNIGDGFTFNQHLDTVDKSQAQVFRVTEIVEKREAKGNHQLVDLVKPNYYKLIVEARTENIKNLNHLISE